MSALPITGLSNVFDCALLTIAWLVIGARLRKFSYESTPTIRYIRSYFGYFAIFNAIMAAPTLLIAANRNGFSSAMGWGYGLANVFLIISLTYLSVMEASLVPRIAKRLPYIVTIWVAINVCLTALNIYFVALHNQPTFSSATGVTQFHFPAFLGPVLGAVSLAAYLPGVVLFARNGINQTGDRKARSWLLASGMLIIMVVGPLHAAASKWQLFVVADALNVLSLVLLTSGVLYRLDRSTQESRNAAPTPVRS